MSNKSQDLGKAVEMTYPDFICQSTASYGKWNKNTIRVICNHFNSDGQKLLIKGILLTRTFPGASQPPLDNNVNS